jgi:hypothetical protein
MAKLAVAGLHVAGEFSGGLLSFTTTAFTAIQSGL